MTVTSAPLSADACAFNKLRDRQVSVNMPERTERSVAVYTVMTAVNMQPAATSVGESHSDMMVSVMPSSYGLRALAEAPTKNRRSRAGIRHRNVPALTSFSLTLGSERYVLTCQWSPPKFAVLVEEPSEASSDASARNT